MRVPGDPGSPPPPVTGESSRPQSKSFDKVLQRRKENAQPEKKGEVNPVSQEPAVMSAFAAPDAALPAARIVAPAPVSHAAEINAAPQLDGLVQEILVSAPRGADPKVEVQFQSTTLDGLDVSISKQGDKLAIRFLTRSDNVAKLLSTNAPQLSQALSDKGLNVAPIQVELAPPPRAAEPASRSRDMRDSRRGDGGQRQQKQQK